LASSSLLENSIEKIHYWFDRQDQLLNTDNSNILESKSGAIIEMADIQITKDRPHFLLNWLRIYSPILHDAGIKLDTSTSLHCMFAPSIPFSRNTPGSDQTATQAWILPQTSHPVR
jgi:hypothetical protein